MSRGVPGTAAVPRVIRALVPPLVGAVFGVLVVALNHAELPVLRSLSIVTGGGAAWATFGMLMAAWRRRGLLQSVAAGTVALAAAVAAYYVAEAVAANSPLAQELGEMRFWTLGAVVVGPPLGLAGWCARRDQTWQGLTAMLLVPLSFAGESAIYLDGYEWLSPLERATRLTILAGTLAAAALMVGRALRVGPPRADSGMGPV